VQVALAAEVVNKSNASIPRYIIANTGGIQFDLVQGPFTYDDSFIVGPFTGTFVYIPAVPYAKASQVLDTLNALLDSKKKRSLELLESTPDFNGVDSCYDTPYMLADAESRLYVRESESMTRPVAPVLTPGYVTSDDFGTDGDDNATLGDSELRSARLCVDKRVVPCHRQNRVASISSSWTLSRATC
jgi:hypothetical protein